MREISNFTELVRTIFYDIVGLLIPGLLFLTLLLLVVGYCTDKKPFQLIEAVPWQPKVTLAAALVAAYVLGYLIDSLWFVHGWFLLELGRRLLGREREGRPEERPAPFHQGTAATPLAGKAEREQRPREWPSPFHEGTVASPLARECFENTRFFSHVRDVLGGRARFVDPKELRFSDVSSLALSFAGAEADLARQFRYRADLCGAVSTMALLAALGLVPLLVLKDCYPWYWCSAPALLALWIAFLAVPTVPKPFSGDSQPPLQPNVDGKTAAGAEARAGQRKSVLILVRRVLLPLILAAVPLLLAWRKHGGWSVVCALPALSIVWMFMLWRAYFYLNLGGRVHFGIALAVIAGRPAQMPAPAMASGAARV